MPTLPDVDPLAAPAASEPQVLTVSPRTYDAISVGLIRVSMRMTPISWVMAAGAVASLSIACSALLDANVVQCSVDSDCAGRGFTDTKCVNKVCAGGPDASTDVGGPDAAPTDPKWGCIGNVKWGAQIVEQKVLYRSRFVHLIGEAPVTRMNVTACGVLDLECSKPLGSGTTDETGYVNLSVPKNFSGFFSLEPPPMFANMVPSLSAIFPPPEKDDDPAATIPANLAEHLASAGELNSLLSAVDAKIDPSLSTILGIILDCQGNPASGVSIRMEVRNPKTLGYYTDDTGTPSVTAQESGFRGEAGFVNTPTGPITIEATVQALSKKMGKFTVFTKAGHITYIPMVPSPSP